MLFIDIAHHLIGMRWLWNAASRGVGATVVAHAHAARRPVGGRGEVELAISDVRVGAIADEVGAVDAGAFGDQEIGAGLRFPEGDKQDENKEGFDAFH